MDIIKIVEKYKKELNDFYNIGWHPHKLFGTTDTAVKVCEAQALYSLIREHKYSNILEIGTGTGFSSLYFARALKDGELNGFVDSIDVSASAQARAKKLHIRCGLDNVNFICGDSTKIVPLIEKEYDVCLIDGCHDYQPCKQDFINIFSKIKKGGCIVFDDIQPRINKNNPYWVWKEIVNGEIVDLEHVEICEFDEKLCDFFSYESDMLEVKRLKNKWAKKSWIENDINPCRMMSVLKKT